MKVTKADLRLYAITDRQWLGGKDFYMVVEQVLKNGATFLQLREKNTTHEQRVEEAKKIKQIAAKYHVPFVVNDETKEMVMKNIAFLLAQFLSCSAYQNVIFCWVMDHQEIIDELVARVEEQTEEPFEIYGFTLTLTPEALKERIGKDIESGLRKPDAVNRSTERLTLYETVETEKIDVSTISAGEAAKKVAEKISAAVCS